MYIVPAESREYEEEFDVSSVNFTWQVTNYGDWEGQSDPVLS